MPKYNVSIAREETTLYWIEVEAEDEDDAEEKAWDEFNQGAADILDHGELVNANEYVDYVEEIENEHL